MRTDQATRKRKYQDHGNTQPFLKHSSIINQWYVEFNSEDIDFGCIILCRDLNA